MASPTASTPSLSPSRTHSSSPSPSTPAYIQPDHFFNLEEEETANPISPGSSGGRYLSPEDDPLATRGVPVFKPTVEEFGDFEAYMNKVEYWGMKSGVVKIVPPKEWIDSLPPILPQLQNARVNHPIEQQILGRAGLYRAQNIERRKWMSVREWAEMCAKEELRTPGVDDVALKVAEAETSNARPGRRGKGRGKKNEVVVVVVKAEEVEEEVSPAIRALREESPLTEMDDLSEHGQDDVPDEDHEEDQADGDHPRAPSVAPSHISEHDGHQEQDEEGHGDDEHDDEHEEDEGHEQDVTQETPAIPTKRKTKRKSRTRFSKPKPKPKVSRPMRFSQTRAGRAAALERREQLDAVFFTTFDPVADWLPPNTSPHDYTNAFCAKLERKFWRNIGLGRAAWYGADSSGTLFTPSTSTFNLAALPSTLSRLLPSSAGLPGVNTPYLYFGMWKATFAWHVEDMDLHSINYVHFGAPKFWYAMPQGKATAFENFMRSRFPHDTSLCPQFLRHKSFLASPHLLADSSCRPLCVVQHAGEFVVTYPRGYHAGFNLGFNCAEAVNFATERWIEIGRKAAVCKCVNDSVRIDVEELVKAREEGRTLDLGVDEGGGRMGGRMQARKRMVADLDGGEDGDDSVPKKKRVRIKKETVDPSTSADTSAPMRRTKVTLKLPAPPPVEFFPCCLCVSPSADGLLPVANKPGPGSGCQNVGSDVDKEVWRAHEECALVVPETWVEVVTEEGGVVKEKVVYGVDLVVKDRWNLRCTACPKSKQKAKQHGAKIQCTKGKCSKAFHVSCAKEGGSRTAKSEQEAENDAATNAPGEAKADGDDAKESRIVWKVLEEVDVDVGGGRVEQVVEVNPVKSAKEGAAAAAGAGGAVTADAEAGVAGASRSVVDEMDVDQSSYLTPQIPPPSVQWAALERPALDIPIMGSLPLEGTLIPYVDVPPYSYPTKMVKKLRVELLCTQHSPITAANKRANKSNRLRAALAALPNMARIKIRVHSGVFEVSLIRVIEERGSVEVLWDGGQPREFKWSSVVLGKSKEGEVVGQKPDVMAEPSPVIDALKANRARKEREAGVVIHGSDVDLGGVDSTTGQRPSNTFHGLHASSSRPISYAPNNDLSSSSASSSRLSTITPAPASSQPMYYSQYGNAASGQYPYGGGITYQQYSYPQYQQYHPVSAPYSGSVAGPSQPPQYGVFSSYNTAQPQAGPSGTSPVHYPPGYQQTAYASDVGGSSQPQTHPTTSSTLAPSAANDSPNASRPDPVSSPVSKDLIDALRKVTEHNLETLDANKLKELLQSTPEFGEAIKVLLEHSASQNVGSAA